MEHELEQLEQRKEEETPLGCILERLVDFGRGGGGGAGEATPLISFMRMLLRIDIPTGLLNL